jgi:bacterioferritin
VWLNCLYINEAKEEITMPTFLSDIKKIRERARRNMDQGPVTESYKADLTKVIQVLNQVLATEIVCVLRYRRHYFMAQGIDAEPVAQEFLQHANDEQQHADWVAKRIVQLGGEPDFNPEGLATRSHAEYVEGNSLIEMIQEDLVAERIAIESYTEIIRWLGNDDPTSRKLIEDILKMEEEHADDLANMLKTLDPTKSPQT